MSSSDFTISSDNSDNEGKKTRGPYNKDKFLRKPCSASCPLGCTKQISQNQRQQILNYFYGLADINLRRLFVQKSVKRVNSDTSYPSLEFYFTINGKRVQVCRLFFLATLSIQINFIQRSLEMVFDNQIRQIKKKHITAGMPPQSEDQQPTKKAESLKKVESSKVDTGIMDHIKSVPRIISVIYENNKPIYTEFSVNIDTMFELYVKYCKERNLPQANFSRYKELFEECNAVFRECQKSLPLLDPSDSIIVRLD